MEDGLRFLGFAEALASSEKAAVLDREDVEV